MTFADLFILLIYEPKKGQNEEEQTNEVIEYIYFFSGFVIKVISSGVKGRQNVYIYGDDVPVDNNEGVVKESGRTTIQRTYLIQYMK